MNNTAPSLPANLHTLTDAEFATLASAVRQAAIEAGAAIRHLYVERRWGQPAEEHEREAAPYQEAYRVHVKPFDEPMHLLWKEEKRRKTLATRARNAQKNAALAQAATSAGYTVGQVVEVQALGRWYWGEVVKVGKARVTVRYTTGTGVTRVKPAPGNMVRPLR